MFCIAHNSLISSFCFLSSVVFTGSVTIVIPHTSKFVVALATMRISWSVIEIVLSYSTI